MPQECCLHKATHYEDWPDGGQIEVCDDCKMSRHHSEWDSSPWIMIKDIPAARKRLQEDIDAIVARARKKHGKKEIKEGA